MENEIMNINSMLLIDFYKATHDMQLPKGIDKSVSYFTPRMSRVDIWNDVVMFGIQGFCKNYLIEYFNDNFFNLPYKKAVGEYERILNASLGSGAFCSDKIKKLHELGYLPIEIISLPEGTLVPMHVPMFGITNTHKDFAWLPQALESLISAEVWHPMISATVGNTYRNIVNKYYDISVDNNIAKSRALGDFSFRGQECLQSAIKSSAGWALSFLNSATVPAIPYIEKVYNCDCTKDDILYGAVSTEHSIMCSNYAVDGDEITLLRKLLTEIYPNTSFSAVLDSYDYWNVVENILPQLKSEIMNHNGTLLIRGDSGDCVEIVTRTVFKLWDMFGGTINSKGYKVLDSHVRAIYGDSITIQRCEEIYKILIDNGFACNNVVLGVGSFSMQCIEEYGELKPFTRDTFSSCIKATYCEINGMSTLIFKNPKDGGFKKSQKGCCRVYSKNDTLCFEDGLTWKESHNNNLLQTIFKDGEMIKEQTLNDVRTILNKGNF